MWCTEPVPIYTKGVPGTFEPGSGTVQRPMRHCGRCRSCIAGAKNDWTGRLSAEAGDADSVYFLTMTYAEEPRDPETGKRIFRYKDIQRMLYLMRAHLKRHYGGSKMRFFCVGEFGERKGRIHWHMLAFMKGPHMLPDAWNAKTNRRQLWQYWPHGWTEIARVPPEDTIRRVRYCAKYAVKSYGQTDETCRPRFSTVPMIGAAFAERLGRETAECALPMQGAYTLPGHIWTKGVRKGQHIRYRLRGSGARRACAAYVDAWNHHLPWDSTHFLRTYCPEQLVEKMARWPQHRMATIWNVPDSEFEKAQAAHKSRREKFDKWCEAQGVTARNPYVSPKLCLPIPEWQEKLWWQENGYGNQRATKAEIEEASRDQAAANAIDKPRADAESAKIFRRSQIERHFWIGYTSPVVETYIETGGIGDHTGPEAQKIDDISAGEGHRWEAEAHRWEADAYADKRRSIETDSFEARRKIWARFEKTGEVPVETVDAETGEVSWVAVPWNKQAAREPKPQPIGCGFAPKASGLYASAVAISDAHAAQRGRKG